MRADLDAPYPWYYVREEYPSVYNAEAYKKLLPQDVTRIESELGFADHFEMSNGDAERLFRYPGQEKPRPGVEGGIARVYASYGLHRTFGPPYEDLCQTKVLLQVYENGYVMGGAPVDNCGGVQGIYFLLEGRKKAGGAESAHREWHQRNKYPLFADYFDKRCVK